MGIGDPSVMLWTSMYSPYSDFEDAKHSFYALKDKLTNRKNRLDYAERLIFYLFRQNCSNGVFGGGYDNK